MIAPLILLISILTAPGAAEKKPNQFYKRTEPTIGYNFGPFPNRYLNPDGTTTVRHRQFFEMGLPIKMQKYDIEGDFPAVQMLIKPEVMFSGDLFILDAEYGPEIKVSNGWNSFPSAIFYGLQAGVWYNAFIGDTVPLDGRYHYALMFDFNFGPTFDIRDWFTLKVALSTKFLVGKIARHTVSTNFNSNVGCITGINLQLEFF